MKPSADLSILNRNATQSSDSDDSSEIEEPQTCYAQMTFKPKKMSILVWDFLMSILTVVQLCKTTFMLGFDMKYEDRLIDTVIDAVFAGDILMHFFRAYLDDVEVITSF